MEKFISEDISIKEISQWVRDYTEVIAAENNIDILYYLSTVNPDTNLLEIEAQFFHLDYSLRFRQLNGSVFDVIFSNISTIKSQTIDFKKFSI